MVQINKKTTFFQTIQMESINLLFMSRTMNNVIPDLEI